MDSELIFKIMVICVKSRMNPVGILLSFYYVICHVFVMNAYN
jgi:hypothetical protein